MYTVVITFAYDPNRNEPAQIKDVYKIMLFTNLVINFLWRCFGLPVFGIISDNAEQVFDAFPLMYCR